MCKCRLQANTHDWKPSLMVLTVPFDALQEDEGDDDADYTPLSQDNPGGSRRFSLESIMPHRAVDPRAPGAGQGGPSTLSSTSSSLFRGRSGQNSHAHLTSHALMQYFVCTASIQPDVPSLLCHPDPTPLQQPNATGAATGVDAVLMLSAVMHGKNCGCFLHTTWHHAEVWQQCLCSDRWADTVAGKA